MTFPFIGTKRRTKSQNFFKLSSRDQKKIIMKAVKESNEKQLKLYKKHSYLFGVK